MPGHSVQTRFAAFLLLFGWLWECIAGAVLDASTGIVGAALAFSVLSCCSGGDKEGTVGVVSVGCDASSWASSLAKMAS